MDRLVGDALGFADQLGISSCITGVACPPPFGPNDANKRFI
jgi:hypothetical protein